MQFIRLLICFFLVLAPFNEVFGWGGMMVGGTVISSGGGVWPPWADVTGTPNTKIVPAGGSITQGIAYTGTNIVITDDGTSKLYDMVGMSSVIDNEYLPSVFYKPRGATFDGTNLIVIEDFNNKIFVFNGVSASYSSFSSPATEPAGLTFDGTNLLSSDLVTKRIYTHVGVSAAISGYITTAHSVYGLTFDGTNLISADVTTIYVHDGMTSAILYSFNAVDGGYAARLSFDGTNLLSSYYGGNGAYVHPGIAEYTGPL